MIIVYNNFYNNDNSHSYYCPGNSNRVGMDGVTKIHFPGKKRNDSTECSQGTSLREHLSSLGSSTYPFT